MPTPRDPAVTEYVRAQIRELLDSKKYASQRELAARTGLSEAYISTLWKTGVGGRSIAPFAKVLGFTDADALRRAAYEFFQANSPQAAVRRDEPEVAEALVVLRGLYPIVSEERWDSLLARFAHPDFVGRDRHYWISVLGLELAQDSIRETRSINERAQNVQNERRKDGKRKREIQGAFREASREKKRLADLVPPPAPVVPATKRANEG